MDKNKDLISTILSDYELTLTKIILYCISELPFPLGIRKTISVLKGTKSTFAINNKLQHLVTFSLLSSFSKTQLITIIEALILAELIKIENVSVYGNMPVLKLTEKGSNCLNGKEMLLISFLDALTDNEIQEFNESENALF
ncbi:RQC domain-containing protein [Niabella ginsengisoli]|uniref:RQC domain-containing protein n=1 Tax=Niabella ginsengisoli TaxID=522298 RepID=A0ABS9SFF7_9BACT|nr:RQC domain-containing protein [Niabella ginsengisoli]MCH5597090.1 hypothetical protein [Niabella ginsengisoli]